jgi:hypothetical protein
MKGELHPIAVERSRKVQVVNYFSENNKGVSRRSANPFSLEFMERY